MNISVNCERHQQFLRVCTEYFVEEGGFCLDLLRRGEIMDSCVRPHISRLREGLETDELAEAPVGVMLATLQFPSTTEHLVGHESRGCEVSLLDVLIKKGKNVYELHDHV